MFNCTVISPVPSPRPPSSLGALTGTRREPRLRPFGASDWLRGSSRLLCLRPHWARGAASGTSKRVRLALRLSLAGGSLESARRERRDAGAARDLSSFPQQPPGSAPLPAPPRSPGTCYGHVYPRGKSEVRQRICLFLTGVIFRYGFPGSAAREKLLLPDCSFNFFQHFPRYWHLGSALVRKIIC